MCAEYRAGSAHWALTIVTLALIASGTDGTSAQTVAWVVANQPSAASYTPAPGFNSTGANNTITRDRAGVYTLKLPNALMRGPVHVTAIAGQHRCTTAQLGGPDWVKVHCFNSAGGSVDGRFVALAYTEKTGTSAGVGAYLWYDGRTTINSGWSSNGGTNQVRKLGVGTYEATFANQSGSMPGALIVTAWTPVNSDGGPAAGSARHCNGVSYTQSGANVIASIRCYSAPGRLADSWFVASFLRDPFVGSPYLALREGGFTSGVGSRSTINQSVTRRRVSEGVYELSFDGLSPVGFPFVVASASSDRCILLRTKLPLRYECYVATGIRTDGMATVLYLTTTPHPRADVAAHEISFRIVKQRGRTRATVEVTGVIRNAGTRVFNAGAMPSTATLFQGNTVIATLPLTTIPVGGMVSFQKDIEWDASVSPVPSFRLQVTHHADILRDFSFDNDDRNPDNHLVTRTGADINVLFR